MGVALSVAGLRKAFGKGSGRREVVSDVALAIPQGGSLALVGGSGCGKTTVLRMVASLEAPDAGTIQHGGERPQLVFQDAGASLTPWMTVGAHLRERLAVCRVPSSEHEARVAHALELVGLRGDVGDRRPGALSGGQRQRVALARAVIVPPAVLACDEPTSALDVSLAATVINLLRRLREQLGVALLFVTHDLAVARAVADEIAVMHDGRIVEQGPAERVLSDPRDDYTRRLVEAVPQAEGI